MTIIDDLYSVYIIYKRINFEHIKKEKFKKKAINWGMNDQKNIIQFKDLVYEVKNKDKEIKTKYATIINGLSGQIESGKVTAVMGASGCGKTHFFELLIGNLSTNCKTSGEILYNGIERDSDTWTKQISFLPQDDIYYPDYTLYESIMYNLSFNNLPDKENDKTAEEVMKNANIFSKRDAPLKSLSGGERKRAMIAITLANNPEILILDEPTTGLDSSSALKIVESLKKYAEQNNKIVIMTVHQPGDGLFNLFDDLIFLTKGGLFYSGAASNIKGFLSDNGIVPLENMSVSELLFVLHSDVEESDFARKYQSVVEDIVYRNVTKQDLPKAESCNNQRMIYGFTNIRHTFLLLKHNLRLFYKSPNFFRNFSLYLGVSFLFYLVTYFGAFKKTVISFSEMDPLLKDLRLSSFKKYAIAYQLYLSHFSRETLLYSILFSINSQELDILNLEMFTQKYSFLSHFLYIYIEKFLSSLVFLTIDFLILLFLDSSRAIPLNIMGRLYLIILVSLLLILLVNILINSLPIGKKMAYLLVTLQGVFVYLPNFSELFAIKTILEDYLPSSKFLHSLNFLYPNFCYDLYSSIIIVFYINSPINDPMNKIFKILTDTTMPRRRWTDFIIGQLHFHNRDPLFVFSYFKYFISFKKLVYATTLTSVFYILISRYLMWLKFPNLRIKLTKN